MARTVSKIWIPTDNNGNVINVTRYLFRDIEAVVKAKGYSVFDNGPILLSQLDTFLASNNTDMYLHPNRIFKAMLTIAPEHTIRSVTPYNLVLNPHSKTRHVIVYYDFNGKTAQSLMQIDMSELFRILTSGNFDVWTSTAQSNEVNIKGNFMFARYVGEYTKRFVIKGCDI